MVDIKKDNDRLINEISKDNRLFEKDELPDIPRFETEKEKQKYLKKLKTEIQSRRIKKVGDKATELKDIEQELILSSSGLMDRILTKRIYVGIIKISGGFKLKKTKLNGNFVNVDKNTYKVKNKALYKYKNGNISFYFEGNPHPIEYDFDKYEPIVNSSSLYTAWNSKIVSDLLSGGSTMSTGQKITIGLVFAVAIGIVMVMGSIKDTTTAPIILLISKQLWNRWFT